MPTDPLPLDYAHPDANSAGPIDPLTRRLVLGTLSLIATIAAAAILLLGGAMHRTGGNVDRLAGAMLIYASIIVAAAALFTAALALRRAHEARRLAIFALTLNLALWAAGAYFLFR